jgi:Xaa-Pro aminopeptidase
MKRVSILRGFLPKLKVDALLITDIKNVRYLSGFTGSAGSLLIIKRHSFFITDFRYKEQARYEVKDFEVKVQNTEMPEYLSKLVKRCRIKTVGFEDRGMSFRMYKELVKRGIKLKALTDVVERFRCKKSEEEISYIKKAIKRSENAFKRLKRYIKEGVMESELSVRLEGFLREEGCINLPFNVIVASGYLSALPHAKPTNKKIKNGDMVLFDWGGECNGYYSDMTRMVAVGERQKKKLLKIYQCALHAQKNAIESIKPGVSAVKVDASARDFIKKMGYNKYFGHGTGHGIGLAVHEKPIISWHSKDVLEEGMVFTIEPGIYLPGIGGVRVEDMVLVTREGAEVLTTLPRWLGRFKEVIV